MSMFVAVIEFFLARPALSHGVLALLIMAAVLLVTRPFRVANAHWIGAALAVGFYWGREKRDHENRLDAPMAEVWYRGWAPWEWNAKDQEGFLWAFLACLLLALVLHFRRRR
ncbi:hypothetical protein [Aquibaculum arenosum]|uniref:Uncharacterized protein n=1 Tax=Aquibaculum arenosum TaxID=3032591 RepID=A0ABT5YND6_9PROT|nr:hypothetical protein [Fodinicurvata sp. CAU 1616]MDF2096333.1 hypothetical protein [Fodinicurvata sp. CAU 1616]